MYQIPLQDAETQLTQLINHAAKGEEVIITRSDGASFKIVPVQVPQSSPKFGSAKGRIRIAANFEDPLED